MFTNKDLFSDSDPGDPGSISAAHLRPVRVRARRWSTGSFLEQWLVIELNLPACDAARKIEGRTKSIDEAGGGEASKGTLAPS